MSRLTASPDELTVHLIEDRRAVISPYGIGNAKLGLGVYTYSRLPATTCPGATDWCLAKCYAIRAMGENKELGLLWQRNSVYDSVPSPPADATLVRWHVSGDFDTNEYIRNWIKVVEATPDVTYWGYTRSWSQGTLVADLAHLRDLPNVQLFASLDPSTESGARSALRVTGWRLAEVVSSEDWVRDGSLRHIEPMFTPDVSGYVCPEETGHKNNCVDCGYCFKGRRGDVIFLEH